MRYQTILLIVMLCFSAVASGKEARWYVHDVELLVTSCQEALNVYATKENTHSLARLTTSLSEALRAGYCIGVVQQYMASSHCYRRSGGWRNVAQNLVNLSAGRRPGGVQQLLKDAACD